MSVKAVNEMPHSAAPAITPAEVNTSATISPLLKVYSTDNGTIVSTTVVNPREAAAVAAAVPAALAATAIAADEAINASAIAAPAEAKTTPIAAPIIEKMVPLTFGIVQSQVSLWFLHQSRLFCSTWLWKSGLAGRRLDITQAI